MAKHERTCLVCGRVYIYYDASPKFFCSVGCEADAGSPVDLPVHRGSGKARPAKTARRKKP